MICPKKFFSSNLFSLLIIHHYLLRNNFTFVLLAYSLSFSVLHFIHSFNRYLLIHCYILGIVLNTTDTVMNITKQKFSVLVWLVDLFSFKVWSYTFFNCISLLSSISFLYFSFHSISFCQIHFQSLLQNCAALSATDTCEGTST